MGWRLNWAALVKTMRLAHRVVHTPLYGPVGSAVCSDLCPGRFRRPVVGGGWWLAAQGR